MKTISLKKVSAVAVAALGFGLLSVVPASAATTGACTAWTVSSAGKTTSINLTAVTANTNVQGTSVGVNVGIVHVALGATGATAGCAFQRYSAYLSSTPAGGSVAVASAAATTPTAPTGTAIDVTTPNIEIQQVTTEVATTAGTVTATGAVGLGKFTFTPNKVGTYVMTVWGDSNTDGIVQVTEVSQTISITTTASATLAAAASVLRMAPNATLAVTQNHATTTLTNYSTAVDAVPRSGVKTLNTAIAQVAVVLVNNDATPALLHVVTADITGAGLVLCNNSGTAATGTVRSSAVTLTGTDNVAVCHISADGTSGEGTVTISVTDSVTGVKTKLGSKSFYSWGTVSKLAIDTKPFTIGKAGSPTGGAQAARRTATEISTAAGFALGLSHATITTPAFTVAVTDSSAKVANIAAAGVPTVTSSATSVVSGGTCVADDGLDADFSSGTGVGIYNCNFNTVSGAASGSKATLTLSTLDPADPLGVAKLTATVDVTVGGSISTEVVSFNKTSYAPGEAMTITMTAKDASNNPVFDGATSPALTFSKAIGGTAPAAGIYVGGTKSTTSAKGVVSVFAPAVSGAFSAVGTSGNAAASALSAASSVTDGNAALLTQIDALNAKIVALNALIAKIMKKLGVK